MKIDLGKELQLDQIAVHTPQRLRVLMVFSVVNLLVALAALALALRPSVPAQPPSRSPADMGIDTQAIARTDERLRTIERSMHDLRAMVVEYKMAMKELVAKQRIDDRRGRIRADGRTGTVASVDIQAAARALPLAWSMEPVVLADVE